MSTHLDLAERLRRANPVSPEITRAPPAGMLGEIVSTPRLPPPRDALVTSLRRPVLASVVVLLLAAGLAIAGTISVRYFGEGSSTPMPPSVRTALAYAASHTEPWDRLALADTIQAYTFASGDENGSVYMAPYASKPGFCAALAVRGKTVQATCTSGWAPPFLATTSSAVAGIPRWSITLTPDMHALLGRLERGAVGDGVQLVFEDGTTVKMATRGPWFAYAVAGTHAQRGHRPVQIHILRNGRVRKRIALNPVSFNTLAEARAVVPASDGSPGQNAIRRMLLRPLKSSALSDGGLFASHVDISATARLDSLRFKDGTELVVYGTPVRSFPGWPGTSALVTVKSGHEVGFLPAPGASADSRFDTVIDGSSNFGRHHWSRFVLLVGGVPRRVARIVVRTGDGREHPVRVFNHGASWAWLAPRSATTWSTTIIGRDASGAVIARR